MLCGAIRKYTLAHMHIDYTDRRTNNITYTLLLIGLRYIFVHSFCGRQSTTLQHKMRVLQNFHLTYNNVYLIENKFSARFCVVRVCCCRTQKRESAKLFGMDSDFRQICFRVARKYEEKRNVGKGKTVVFRLTGDQLPAHSRSVPHSYACA